jgi:hypothetical protein
VPRRRLEVDLALELVRVKALAEEPVRAKPLAEEAVRAKGDREREKE